MPSASDRPLVVLVGPTGVGKSDIAIELAEQLPAEIVSADSRLFYVGMDIGTAKPSPAQRRRVPHHLIDIARPDQTVSLAEFQEMLHAAITSIHDKGGLPLLVGGTGQYIRAVTEGWSPPAVAPRPSLRAALTAAAQQRGGEWLHDGLRRLDPAAAERIDARNVRRTVRALEVIFSTGRPFSVVGGRRSSTYRLVAVGLRMPRDKLYARIDTRIERMFAEGLLDEVRGLIEAGCRPDLPAMSAIGYSECIAVLNGELTVEQAKERMRRATRILVRRQANWFRETNAWARWFDVEAGVVSQLTEYLCGQLHAPGN